MRRITKWIQDRKAYSNPVFGLMLTINVMVLPTFQAAAAMDEPVQSVVLNEQDVLDAIDAVEAGLTAEESFLEQSKPYRALATMWRSTYEELFSISFPKFGDPYFLDYEIDADSLRFGNEGTTESGQEFEIDFLHIEEVDIYSEEAGLSEESIEALENVSTSSFAIVAVLRTENAEITFSGSLVQWGVGASRNREIVILSLLEDDIIETFYSQSNLLYVGDVEDVLEVSDGSESCSACTAHARNAARLRIDIAKILLNSALATATLWLIGRGILCVAASVIPAVGMIGTASCIFHAALEASAMAAVATGLFNTARLISNARLRAALEDCYIDHPGCRPI